MSRVMFSIGDINIYWYSFLMFAAVVIGIYLASKEARRVRLSATYLNDLIFYLIPIGIIGARAYYVIFNFHLYEDNLIDIFKVWEGGLAIYGSVIAGAIFTIFYAHKKEKSIVKTMDIIVPSLILGQAIGRWGNFFNGEAYGPETTLSFLQKIHLPNFIIDGMHIDGGYYQPAFLYEFLWCLLGFIILLLIRYLYKNKNNGLLVSFYFIWYGIGRFFIEALRQDSLYLGSIKVSQAVSIILIIIGIVGIVLSYLKGDKYHDISGRGLYEK